MIEVRGLRKEFRVHRRRAGLGPALRSLFRRDYERVMAVDGIDFAVAEGERVGFLGPNGAGKTTTLKILAGLLHPTAGEVRVAGHVPQRREAAFLKKITLVMGQKQQLLWDLPPAETFALNRAVYDIPRRDNNGMTITSTVHYSTGYDNAYWSGPQMVYGDAHGWPLADDIVAHELTHGVTQFDSNLFYSYQSGAINESLSDVFGEYYDQTNGQGNDTAGVKWQIGEDISGLGAFRSMSNPPSFGDPDRMSSPYYYEGEEDSGGVHWNSGVNNKAVYLMVNGGSFNGKTVTALGWEKVDAIYYKVQTDLLTSA